MLPLVSFLGILSGYLLHPQFPNTFLIWWAQGCVALQNALGPFSGIVQGAELNPASLRDFILSSGVFAAVFAVSLLGARLLSAKRLSAELLASWLVALFFSLVFIWQPRGIEYACPFAVLALALAIKASRALNWRSLPSFSHPAALLAFCLALAVFASFSWRYAGKGLEFGARYKKLDGVARFLLECGVPPGTAIANVNWSDFPALFYSAPQFRYLCGLDPVFGFLKSPERMSKIEAFRTGRAMLPREELAKLTGSTLAYVSIFDAKLAEAMSRNGYPIVYQGSDGWLFELVKPVLRLDGP